MLNEQKITKEQVATFSAAADINDLAIGNSRVGIGIIMAMAGFVGIWGSICLVNGIIQSQNIHEIARGIVTAFTGI